jgi:hypothetical protein
MGFKYRSKGDWMKYKKCPACGYNLYKNYNHLNEIKSMIEKRNDSTKLLLRKIASLISNNVPTDKSHNRLMMFLKGIEKTNDNIVSWGIEQYYAKKYYLTGKGYSYLSKIITNRNKNLKTVAKNERKMIGSPPPTIKTKESK